MIWDAIARMYNECMILYKWKYVHDNATLIYQIQYVPNFMHTHAIRAFCSLALVAYFMVHSLKLCNHTIASRANELTMGNIGQMCDVKFENEMIM